MGYGVIARSFHWISAVIVLTMIPVGLIMTEKIPKSIQNPLFVLHKGLGSVFLVILLARLGWRMMNPPPPLPDDIPRAQRLAAEATHFGLYVFLVIMAVSGYVFVTAGGYPIEWLKAIGIPPLLPKMETVSKIAEKVHIFAKYGLIALVILHIAAAMYHGFMRRDGLLSRMWPPFSR